MLDFLVGNDALSAIVAFVLVLIPAIFVHELGHFLAAKAVGLTILEFGIGFPPRMVTLFRRGETEYTLNWLPIGGFVRPLGEDLVRPVSDSATAAEREKLEQSQKPAQVDSLQTERAALRARGVKRIMSVNEAKPISRIIFMAAGSTANLLTAIVLFVIIGLSGLPTIVGNSAGVVSAEAGSSFAEAGLQTGDIIETVNGEYFDSTEILFNRLEALADEPVALAVQREDETFEIILTPDDVNAVLNGMQSLVFISGVAPGSPAEEVGLQVDDVIVEFNGESFSEFNDLLTWTQENLGEEIQLTVWREGETLDISVVPRVDPPPNEGSIGIGIVPAYGNLTENVVLVEGGFQQALVPLSFGESVQFAFSRIGFFVQTLVELPGQLAQGALSPEETRLMSPLAISQFGGVFLQQSIEQDQPVVILNYIAIISIALGITNLLPLPALDGGRILFVLLEIVRGRPISPEREGIVHLIGMAFLLSLMAIAFINDVFNPVTNLLP